MSDKRGANETKAIEQQAADFVLALASTPTAELKQSVSAWLNDSPAHAVAFARAEQAWDMAGQLPRDRLMRASAGSMPGEPASTPDIPVDTMQPPTMLNEVAVDDLFTRPRTRRRFLAFGAVAATAAGALGIGFLRNGNGISTAVGEVRDIALSDGSTMHLNTNSRAVIEMTPKRRFVRLLQGEAFFDVAHNPDVPFDVEVDGAIFRALGTAFNIRIRPELVELTVTNGLVGVSAPAGQAEKVPAGQGAFVQPNAVSVAKLPSEEVEQRTLWRSGVIELNGESLAQAVDEFNRYRTNPIVIGDQRIAPLRVGGRFHTDDVQPFLFALRQTLPIEARLQSDGGVLLLSRDGDGVMPNMDASPTHTDDTNVEQPGTAGAAPIPSSTKS